MPSGSSAYRQSGTRPLKSTPRAAPPSAPPASNSSWPASTRWKRSAAPSTTVGWCMRWGDRMVGLARTMEPSTNPYQSPEAVPAQTSRTASNDSMPREGWKYVLLALAILGGLVSFVPGLAILFLVLSAPIFIRYALRARTALRSAENASLPVRLASVLGTVGIALSVLAASAGACLGTCTITGWGTQLTGIAVIIGKALNPDGYLADVAVSFYMGSAVGLLAFFVTFRWLLRRHLGRSFTADRQ